MNNILISLKKFIANKNTITVLGVIIILLLLLYGYNKTIETQIKPVKIPVAKFTIQPRTQITDNMIKMVDVPAAYLSKNVERIESDIIGKYSAINSVIPEGSAFYNDVLITEEQIPSNPFYLVPEGQRPYSLAVTTASTYGNSIMPGNVIDVYMKAVAENGQVMVGKFLEKVKVLAVKDSAGNNVFEDTTANRTPSTLLFGVPEGVYILLKKAEYLKSFGVELFPVPYGGASEITGDLMVGRDELVDFINSNTVTFFENLEDTEDVENTPVDDNTADNQ